MKAKTLIGIILILVSVVGMYLWETKFRDTLTMTEVLVCAEDIAEGDVVNASQFKVISVNTDSTINNCLKEKDLPSIVGKKAVSNLFRNQQICLKHFEEDIEPVHSGMNHFVIPKDWIYSMTSLAGAGCRASFYAMPSEILLGQYEIDLEDKNNIEIWATLSDYFEIYDFCVSKNNSLLVIKEE